MPTTLTECVVLCLLSCVISLFSCRSKIDVEDAANIAMASDVIVEPLPVVSKATKALDFTKEGIATTSDSGASPDISNPEVALEDGTTTGTGNPVLVEQIRDQGQLVPHGGIPLSSSAGLPASSHITRNILAISDKYSAELRDALL